MSDTASLNLSSIPAAQAQTPTPDSPAVATHLTYEQAEEILGPYLDVYLKPWVGNVNNRPASLSFTNGTWEDGDGNILPPENNPYFSHPAMKTLIRKADVLRLADALHASGNPDPRSVNEPDWPKETKHYQKPKKAKAAVAPQVPSELSQALAIPGVNLEVFHAHGAPSVGDLQAFLNGAATPTPDHKRQMIEALARMSGRSSF